MEKIGVDLIQKHLDLHKKDIQDLYLGVVNQLNEVVIYVLSSPGGTTFTAYERTKFVKVASDLLSKSGSADHVLKSVIEFASTPPTNDDALGIMAIMTEDLALVWGSFRLVRMDGNLTTRVVGQA